KVSPGTASAVLNGAGNGAIRVGAAARERVEEAARTLQYRPNALASALRGQSCLVGVVLEQPPQRPSFIQRYIVSLQRALYDRGYYVLLGAADGSTASLEEWVEECRRHAVAGLLLITWSGAPERHNLSALGGNTKDGEAPIVVVGAEAGIVADATVCLDYYGAARIAVSHLLELGHRRFLVVGFDHRVRLAGCHDALTAGGLAPETAVVRWPAETDRQRLNKDTLDWPFVHGRQAILDVYGPRSSALQHDGSSMPPRPTAVVANNDEYAAGALAGLQELGLRVPDDIAVVGCDNEPFGAYQSVPLTTIDYQVEEVAQRAVAVLLEAIDHRQRREPVRGRHEIVPATPVVRRSCGASPAGDPTESGSPARPPPLLAVTFLWFPGNTLTAHPTERPRRSRDQDSLPRHEDRALSIEHAHIAHTQAQERSRTDDPAGFTRE
ncbi:MAG TPA: LacI family DNA-binding transcriptional regulator, partial [Chloroflexota bacterium]|nr:LacI family DNA-binding transcriptional regulator [Chloroflexota bacterium]